MFALEKKTKKSRALPLSGGGSCLALVQFLHLNFQTFKLVDLGCLNLLMLLDYNASQTVLASDFSTFKVSSHLGIKL
jgi:hypothetical protein